MQQQIDTAAKLYRGLIICNTNDQNNKIKFELIRKFKSYNQQQTKIEDEVFKLKQQNKFEFRWNNKVTCFAKRDKNHDFFFYVLLVFNKPLNQDIRGKIYQDLEKIELSISKYSGYASKTREELEGARKQDVEIKIKELEEETGRQISYDNFGIISQDEIEGKQTENNPWTSASPNKRRYHQGQSQVNPNLGKTFAKSQGQNLNQKTFDVTIKSAAIIDEVEPLSVNKVLYTAIGITLIGFAVVLYLIFMG